MLRRTCVVMCLLVAACGGKKEEGAKGDKKSSADKPTGDVATMFNGKTVTLPAEVEKAVFGAPEADVQKAVGITSTYLPSKTHDGVSYDFDFSREEKKLEKITVASKSELEPILTKVWGPPIKNKKGEAFWFDPANGFRAWLPDYAKGKRLTFSKYDSLETLLGPKGFDLAFAKDKPLIGATPDELKAGWGGKMCDFDKEAAAVKASFEEYKKESLGLWHDKKKQLRLCLAQPRTMEQYTPLGDTISFGRMGKSLEVIFSFQTGGSPELQKQMLDFFDAKFGKPTELTSGTSKERWYFDPATKRRAIVSVGEENMALIYGSYLPVTELLSVEAPGALAVQTKSMPGGSPEDIGKEDPDHFNPHGGLPELVYLPTEWVRQETDISLDSWDKDPKTYGYSVTIHHSNNDAAGDEVFKLLEAKFGAGKKDAKSTDKDLYYNYKTKDGKKLEARRVSQQWQLRVTK